MMEYDYLSDEELDQLIMSVEKEIIPAPPDMMENLLALVEEREIKTSDNQAEGDLNEAATEIEKPPQIIDIKRKRAEFRKYCFRVISSVAASIALLVAIPGVWEGDKTKIPEKASIVGENNVTKDEVMKDSKNGIMCAIGQSRALSDLWQLNIFE